MSGVFAESFNTHKMRVKGTFIAPSNNNNQLGLITREEQSLKYLL